jgi:hypothetical protein
MNMIKLTIKINNKVIKCELEKGVKTFESSEKKPGILL